MTNMRRNRFNGSNRNLISVAALIVGLNVTTSEAAPRNKVEPKPQSPEAQPTVTEAAQAGTTIVVPDVTVTAEKRVESVQKVPIAITVVGGEKVLETNITQASDIATLVPNFIAQPTGRAGPRWFLRGIGVADTAYASPIGIHVDDIYISNTGATNFPLFDLERVEVLRGPQGTLWGKNTTAGAINFISKKPTFGEQSSYGEVRFGNFGTKVFEGASGATIVPDRVASRFAFHADVTDGYTTNQFDGTKAGDVREAGLRGQVLVRVTDDLDALFNVHYTNFHDPSSIAVRRGISTRPDGTNGFGYVFPNAGRDYYSSIGPANSDIETIGGFLNLTQHIDDLTFVSISAADGLQSRQQFGTDVPQQAPRRLTRSNDQQVTQEFRLLGPADGQFTWLLGAHLLFETLHLDNSSATLPGGPQSTQYQNINFTTSTTSYAGFASGTYRFNDNFRLTVGVRETRESKSNVQRTLGGVGKVSFSNPNEFWLPTSVSSPLTVRAFQDVAKTWSALTYDITPEYDLAENARIFFRYAKGFRSGAFNTSAGNQFAVNVLNPEYLYDYEGGVKTEWFDKRLIVNGTIFYYDYRNIQVNAVTPSGPGGTYLTTLTNGGKGYSRGIELEVRAFPIPELEIVSNLGLLETAFTQTPFGGDIAVGAQFIRAPHVSATLGGRYAYPLSFGGNLVLATDWNFTSKFFYGVAKQSDLFSQSPTLLGSASLTYENGSYAFGLWSKNITDRRYASAVLPTAYGAISLEQPPRSFGGTFRVRF